MAPGVIQRLVIFRMGHAMKLHQESPSARLICASDACAIIPTGIASLPQFSKTVEVQQDDISTIGERGVFLRAAGPGVAVRQTARSGRSSRSVYQCKPE
jgi:hypothetical protein